MNISLSKSQLNVIDFILNVSDMPNEGMTIYLGQLLKAELKDKDLSVWKGIEKTIDTFESQLRFIDKIAYSDNTIDKVECKKEFFIIHFEEFLKEVYEQEELELVPVYIEQRRTA